MLLNVKFYAFLAIRFSLVLFKTLTNAPQMFTIAIQTPLVITTLGLLAAVAIQDIRGMEGLVQVRRFSARLV